VYSIAFSGISFVFVWIATGQETVETAKNACLFILVFCPGAALLDSFAIVALFFIVGELVKQLAGKIAAESAILKLFTFAAGFYRALLAPEGFRDLNAAFTVHFFAVFTGTAHDSTSRFDHIGSLILRVEAGKSGLSGFSQYSLKLECFKSSVVPAIRQRLPVTTLMLSFSKIRNV